VAVTICSRRIDATLEAGVWHCPDERLRGYLEVLLRLCPHKEGPEDRQALWVANAIGAAIIPKVPLEAPRTPRHECGGSPSLTET
jgi:hypothetical protein